jgi:chemotaxis methyl-accepting protein methylase
MSQTLVTRIFKNTGEMGRPTTMLAYRLKISLVVKSKIAINLSFEKTYLPCFDAVSFRYVLIYLTLSLQSKITWFIRRHLRTMNGNSFVFVGEPATARQSEDYLALCVRAFQTAIFSNAFK